MKVLIQIKWYIIIFIVFSCVNKGQNRQFKVGKNTRNILISKDTLEQVNFDNRLKVLLFRDTINKSKNIDFLKDDSLLTKLKLPTPLDYNGFSVNYLKKEGEYFLLSIEHGSRHYYQTDFYFSLNISSPFALEKIQGKSFDKNFPDKWNEKDSTLITAIPIEKFRLEYFLDNNW